jgi:predicted porin
VTLYGRIDAGYANVESKSSVNSLNSSSKGIRGNGLNSSLWGIKGTEDLGGGLKASFQLESSLNSTEGSGMSGFDRVSTLGLAGNFGEVKIGRDYTPLYSIISAGDIFARTGATTVNLIPAGTRTSNMVSYSTPTFAGVTVKAMAGDNKSSTAGASETTNRTVGLNGTYVNGPLMVGFGWGESKGASSDASTVMNASVETAAGGKQDGSALTASYDFGVAKLFGTYTQAEITTATANVRLKAKETNIGVTVPLGAITLLAAYGYNDIEVNYGADNISGDGNDYVLGATYNLSKRTALYVKTGTYNKIKGTALIVNANYKTTATAFGVRHTF